MYKEFEKQCNSMDLDKEKAILLLIDEWLN